MDSLTYFHSKNVYRFNIAVLVWKLQHSLFSWLTPTLMSFVYESRYYRTLYATVA